MAVREINSLEADGTESAPSGPPLALSPVAPGALDSERSESSRLDSGRETTIAEERAGIAPAPRAQALPRSTTLAALSEAVKAKAGVKRGPKLGTITNLKREVRRAYLQHAGLIDGEKPINANDLNAKVNCLKLQAALIEGSELAKRVEMLEAQSDRALVEVRTAKEDLT